MDENYLRYLSLREQRELIKSQMADALRREAFGLYDELEEKDRKLAKRIRACLKQDE